MAALGISLNSIGITQAKGIDVVMLRDQIGATLPREKARAQADEQAAGQQKFTAEGVKGAKATQATSATSELTPEQQRQVAQLQQIDRAVRAHEQAHLSAGRGVVTSAANFGYVYGPDGKQYAVSGEVGIDTSAEKKPEANIDKGMRIQAAALAPKDPSSQDYRVASIGGQLVAQGRSDLSRQQAEEARAAAPSTQAAPDAGTGASSETAAGDASQRLTQAYSLVATSNRVSVFA